MTKQCSATQFARSSQQRLVGEAASGEEAIIAAAALRPDLILMDVHMPGIGGNEAARTLVERHRNVIVVLMSADLIDRPPRFASGNGEIVIVAKEELSPRTLLDLWHGRETRWGLPGRRQAELM
jgi:CheY-like chemotaxis protein